ncbi:MAG: hypothetical protein J6T74_00230 [Clostridia bacterium]|nr:hypothetical protein [Clostridia bacterium]
MAIIHYNNKNEITSITHKGMVVESGIEIVQVMSDVYEDWAYGVVYDVVADKVTRIYARAEVDASEELIALYKKHIVNEKRHLEAVHKWKLHNAQVETAHSLNITVKQLKKLVRTYGDGKIFDGCVELLSVKKFKSAFRESLATQLRTWLNDPAPKFKFPFSPKQEECVIPYRSRRW